MVVIQLLFPALYGRGAVALAAKNDAANSEVSILAGEAAERWTDSEPVSLTTDGILDNGNMSEAYFDTTPDGRYVVFQSNSYRMDSRLPYSQYGSDSHIYWHDRLTGETRLIDENAGKTVANSYSTQPTISDDGKWIAFESRATNLVSGYDFNSLHPDDADNDSRIYAYNLLADKLVLVSVKTDGEPGNWESSMPEISGDGTKVVFKSRPYFLNQNDSSSTSQIFVRDLLNETTVMISKEEDGNADQPAINYDGSVIAYTNAQHISDNSYHFNVYVFDASIGTPVNITNDETVVADYLPTHAAPKISGDGSKIVFASTSEELVANDNNGVSDIFLYERFAADTTEIAVISKSDLGVLGNAGSITPSISADGQSIGFISKATNLREGMNLSKRDFSSQWAVYHLNLADEKLTNLGGLDNPVWNSTSQHSLALSNSGFIYSASGESAIRAAMNAGERPVWQTHKTISFTELGADRLQLSWSTFDGANAAGYRIYEKGPHPIIPSPYTQERLVGYATGTIFTVMTAPVDREKVSYRVEAVDSSYRVSKNGPILLFAADEEKPTWGSGAKITAQAVTGSSVTLHWPAAIDNTSVSKYKVYQDGALVAEKSTNSVVINSLNSETSYTFYVVAVDIAGNESNPLDAITVTTKSGSYGDLTYTILSNGDVKLTWTKSEEVDKYELWLMNNDLEGERIAEFASDTLTHTETNVLPSGTFSYKVFGYDADQNMIYESLVLTVKTPSMHISKVSMTKNGIVGGMATLGSTETITVNGQPGRTAQVKAIYSTWKDEAGEYTLAVPREVSTDIPMVEGAPGRYTGNFTFEEGVVELTGVEARLVYRPGNETAPVFLAGGLPVRNAAALKLTVQSTDSLKDYKVNITTSNQSLSQSKDISTSGTTGLLVFDRIKGGEDLILRVFNPKGNLVMDRDLGALKAGMINEATQLVPANKKLQLRVVDAEGPVEGIQTVLYSDDGNKFVGTTNLLGELPIVEWEADVQQVYVSLANLPRAYQLPPAQTIHLNQLELTEHKIELLRRPSGTIQGTVRDAGGNPLRGVNVTLREFSSAYGDYIAETVTDQNGYYSMAVLAGITEVIFDAPHQDLMHKTVEVDADEIYTLDQIYGPLINQQLKINLYTTYSDGVRLGPLPIDWTVGIHFDVRVDGMQASSELIPMKRAVGDKVTVSVRGTEAKLNSVSKEVTLGNGYTEVDIELVQQYFGFQGILEEPPGLRHYLYNWNMILSKQDEHGNWIFESKRNGYGYPIYAAVRSAGIYKLTVESNIGQVERVFNHTGQSEIDLGRLVISPATGAFGNKEVNNLSAFPASISPGQWTKARLMYRTEVGISNAQIQINIPNGTELIAGSVTWNGQSKPYTLSEKLMILELGDLSAGAEGMIAYQLQVLPTAAEEIALQAQAVYGPNGSRKTEQIGQTTLFNQEITLVAPANPNTLNWLISGKGTAGSKVSVYASGMLVGKTFVSPGGVWNMAATVPDPKGEKVFAVYAESELSGNKRRTSTVSVHYDPTQPIVQSLTIEQSDGRRSTYDVSNGAVRFPFVVVPGRPLQFEVEFNDPGKVENVAVHIEDSNTTLSAEAQLRNGIYYAMLMPGWSMGENIYVTFDRKPAAPVAPATVEEAIAQLPPKTRNYAIENQNEFIVVDANTLKGSVDMTFPRANDMQLQVEMELQRNTGYVPSAEEIQLAEELGMDVYGLQYQLSADGDDLIIEVSAYVPEDQIGQVASAFGGGKFNKTATREVRLAAVGDIAGKMVKVTAKILLEEGNTAGRVGQEALSFMDSYNALEGAGQLDSKADELGALADRIAGCNPAMAGHFGKRINDVINQSVAIEFAKLGISLAGIVLSPATLGGSLALTAATMAIGAAMDAHISHQTDLIRDGVNKYSQDKCDPEPGGSVTEISLGNPTASPVWIYDPSGYVYETFEDNRIEGVTATVTFWDADANRFVNWNADWFGQSNPQTTDSLGKYGWDVPPGRWQVIYTKAGYERAKSAELVVTPPHFDVNIPMVSYSAPRLTVLRAETGIEGTVITLSSDKYIHESGLTADGLIVLRDGEELEGVWEAIDSRQQNSGGPMLMKMFRFVSDESLVVGNQLDIIVRKDSIVSYSGIEMDKDVATQVTMVATDTQAPTLISASSSVSGNIIVLGFNEMLDRKKAINPADFTLAGTMRSIQAASYGKDGQSIELYLNGKLLTSNQPVVTIATARVHDVSGNAYAGSTVHVQNQVKSANAALSSLQIAGYTISPAFQSNTTTYQAVVHAGVEKLRVTAVTADGQSTLHMNGRKAVSNAAAEVSIENETILVTVTAADGITKGYYEVVIVRGTPSSGNGIPGTTLPPNGGGSSSSNATLELLQREGGEVSIDEEITVHVPPGAFGQAQKITIGRVERLPDAANSKGLRLASAIFDVEGSMKDRFDKMLTITLQLKSEPQAGQIAAIYYYDDMKKQWIKIGGKMKGQKISVQVNRFAQFAVFMTEPTSGFSDLQNHWAINQIAQAIEGNIANGFPDKTFRPNAQISRVEFAVMLARALQLNGDVQPLAFKDAADISSWAKEHVALAVKAGLINGYMDATFRPMEQITRVEMASMISRALSDGEGGGYAIVFADADQIPVWAQSAVNRTVDAGIIQGKAGNRFAPNELATRAEAITMIIRLLNVTTE